MNTSIHTFTRCRKRESEERIRLKEWEVDIPRLQQPRNFSLCPRSLVGVYSGGLGVWFMSSCCCPVEFGFSCFNHASIESWFVWYSIWYSALIFYNTLKIVWIMNCWSHRPRSSRTSHSIDKLLFIRWWPGLFVFTIWSATELIWGKKYLGEGSHLDPPISIPWLRPCLNALSCCHVIGWLAVCVTKQLNRFT